MLSIVGGLIQAMNKNGGRITGLWYASGAFWLLLAMPAPTLADEQDVKMVVTAAVVSENGIGVYEDIADYVGERLGRGARVISGVSYDEANMLLGQGILQVGFICGLPYTREHARGNVHLVATPVIATSKSGFADASGFNGAPGKYFSFTIVRKDSSLNTWAELKGKTYAYSDRDSNSGYNVPRYKLIQLGVRSWEEYFSHMEHSGSHEESIRLVSRGQVDASSVNSLVLQYMRFRGDADALNVRVIDANPREGAGAPPVVVSSQVEPGLRDRLQQIMVSMHKDPQGKAILERALLQRFIPADDADYDGIRAMDETARRVGFEDL